MVRLTSTGGTLGPSKPDRQVYNRTELQPKVTLAAGRNRAKWYEAKISDTYMSNRGRSSVTYAVLVMVDPLLSSDACSSSPKAGNTYCVGPNYY
ncbi:hypothetical protein PDE_06008 [Penicillium oxalicum 114-2]|uniref:Uncharacterized protein n=1 Tax=Penicillium oxalicum (strain 114-2 / CGMCC 5302) TaxID=933388 RepID=S7ZL50_PENO1|nr:hypothetical protein PDE_06008 [Penicillium oxalicum 114-2]